MRGRDGVGVGVAVGRGRWEVEGETLLTFFLGVQNVVCIWRLHLLVLSMYY